jgi:hypothetical protein
MRVLEDVERARAVYEQQRRKVQALQDEMQTVLIQMLEMEQQRQAEHEGDRQVAKRYWRRSHEIMEEEPTFSSPFIFRVFVVLCASLFFLGFGCWSEELGRCACAG